MHRLWAFGLAMGSLWVYCMTLYPSIAGGDAAEFSFVACGPGLAHPPGESTLHLRVKYSIIATPLASCALRSARDRLAGKSGRSPGMET